jgi:hypothetical protein
MPVNDRLRFPAGITVLQAKKDAKSLSKAQAIPLSVALNIIAQRNGMNMPWSKALVSLRDSNTMLASFKLALPESHSHIIDVPAYAPVIAITGEAGSGKSVLSIELAKQQLLNFPRAKLYWTSPIGRRRIEASDASGSNHMPEHMLAKLERNYPGRVEVRAFDLETIIPREVLPAGSVVVVDDVSMIRSLISERPKWIKSALDRGIVLILSGQLTSEMFPEDIPEEVGLILMGRARFLRSPFRDYPGIEQWGAVLSDMPNYGDFVAAPIEGSWAGVVRLTSPDI